MADDRGNTEFRSEDAPGARSAARGRRLRVLFWVLAAWGVAAYLIAPRLLEFYFHRHPEFSAVAHVTETSVGHPGDPLNIALIGHDSQVVRAMSAGGWFPADPITLRTSLRIAADSVLRRPDDEAPVSDLYLFGRKQDLAFEQPVGGSPRKRHHVRFWRWDKLQNGQPVWFGAATFDERVGLSYTTGQITHHIGPDVDAERDRIAADLSQARCVQDTNWIDRFHKVLEGRNGGGDRWRTDGKLAVISLWPCMPGTTVGGQKQ